MSDIFSGGKTKSSRAGPGRGKKNPVSGQIVTGRGLQKLLKGFEQKNKIYRPRQFFGNTNQRAMDVFRSTMENGLVFGVWQQRQEALTAAPLVVKSGEEGNPRAVAAAVEMERQLKRLPFDTITKQMQYGIPYGFAIAEIMWKKLPNGMYGFDKINVAPQENFGFTPDGEIRIFDEYGDDEGKAVPDRKFWHFASRADNAFNFYGRPIAQILHFWVMLHELGLENWAVYIEKFAMPTAMGRYPENLDAAKQMTLLHAVEALRSETAIVIPDSVKIELLDYSSKGSSDYLPLQSFCHKIITLIMLTVTQTTEANSSRAQAESHSKHFRTLVSADSALIYNSFNAMVSRWWTNWNFGEDVPSPIIERNTEEEVDTEREVGIIAALAKEGWRVSPETILQRTGLEVEEVEMPAAQPFGQQIVPPPSLLSKRAERKKKQQEEDDKNYAESAAEEDLDDIDRLTEELVEKTDGSTSAILDQFKAASDKATSFEELSANFASIASKSNRHVKRQSRQIEKSLTKAALVGRIQADDTTKR